MVVYEEEPWQLWSPEEMRRVLVSGRSGLSAEEMRLVMLEVFEEGALMARGRQVIRGERALTRFRPQR